MINLLPPDSKKQIRAARNNHIIRKYYQLLLGVAAVVAIIFAVGFKVTYDQEASYLAVKDQNETKVAEFKSVRTAAQDFSSDLDVAKTILAGDVRLSETITHIASVIPNGVILSNLTLDTQANANAPLIISARAGSFEQAVALKNSLESSPIFENVSLQTATSSNTDSDELDSRYPVTVILNIKYSKAPSSPISNQPATETKK